jgi:formylmethanofuran dehydrogenase subunit C
VSDAVTLTLRAPLQTPISMHAIQPQRFAHCSEREIAATAVSIGRRTAPLGDLFRVSGERSSRVRVTGSTPHLEGLGAGMIDGELVIDGDAGRDLGSGMAGGVIHLRGNAGDGAGASMSGGVVRIDGNATDHLGAAVPGAAKGMTGGEIVVLGSVGSDAGARARRGLIVVAGNTLQDTGRAMIAGSVIVLGSCGANPGRGNKRGTIIACGSIPIPATYRYACTFEPAHVRLTMLYLRRRYGLTIDESLVAGRYRRYCGDAGEPGKGEILELIRPPG